MSDGYRTSARKEVTPLRLRIVAASWTQWLYVLPWVAGLVWATANKTGFEALEQAGAGILFVGVLVFALFPLVSIGAHQEGGEIVVTGARFPGPATRWSLSPEEAKRFSLFEFEQNKKTYFQLALDLADGRRLLLTGQGFAAARSAHERAVERLNAWLEQFR